MSDLVGNPEYRFSRVAAHMSQAQCIYEKVIIETSNIVSEILQGCIIWVNRLK